MEKTQVDFLSRPLKIFNIWQQVSRTSGAELRDGAAPALKVLVCVARSHRLVRRFLRCKILPPLKGVDLKKRSV
jgi:hypothetical protein